MFSSDTSSDLWRIREEEISREGADGFKKNNRLHYAIIDNKKLALEIIEKDRLEYLRKKKAGEKIENLKINERSLSNTPLLLALKRGEMEIVRALLNHPGVEPYFPEYIELSKEDEEQKRSNARLFLLGCQGHGLSPLQWAVMLRQNDIINLLLSKPDVFPFPPITISHWWERPRELGKEEQCDYENYEPISTEVDYRRGTFKCFGYKRDPKTSPYFLYVNDIPRVCAVYGDTGYDAIEEFQDRPSTHIYGAPTYTDIIFHMASLCKNLGWMDSDVHFKVMLRSCDTFKQNFRAGIHSFMRHRNAIKIDIEIARKLAFTPEEKKHFSLLEKKLIEEAKSDTASPAELPKGSSSSSNAAVTVDRAPSSTEAKPQSTPPTKDPETKVTSVKETAITKVSDSPSPLFTRGLSPEEQKLKRFIIDYLNTHGEHIEYCTIQLPKVAIEKKEIYSFLIRLNQDYDLDATIGESGDGIFIRINRDNAEKLCDSLHKSSSSPGLAKSL